MDWLAQLEVVGRVGVALFLGGLIGLERQFARKPAGLRTNMLVAGASALVVDLVNAIVLRFATGSVSPLVRADPVRIVSAVVSAVGFLGAGTIIRRSESHVEGLTTAATLLFVATLGVAVGLRQYLVAAGVTLLALVTLRGVKRIEAKLAGPSEPPEERV